MNIHDIQANAQAKQYDFERGYRRAELLASPGNIPARRASVRELFSMLFAGAPRNTGDRPAFS